MAVSLNKGQGVSLRKREHDLSQVTIGLGWDVAPQRAGFFGFGAQPTEYDLDVVAFLCGANGKIANLGDRQNGQPTLINGDVIFFNNLKHRSGHLWLTGDNRTGEGDGDDEQIIVKLNELSSEYARIVFVVQIYEGEKRKQSFGQVDNAFIRAVDGGNREMVRFDLSGREFANHRSLVFAELVREAEGWKFNAIGQSAEADCFTYFLKQYT